MFSLKSFIMQSGEKLKLITTKPIKSEDEKLLEDLEAVRAQIECCTTRFNLLSDEDLTEACIFELSALSARYRYLLKIIKEKHIHCAFAEQAKMERTG